MNISSRPEDLVVTLATATPWRHQALAAVAALGLPDTWVGAGFVRAPVWDHLHGFAEATPLDDIDVVYFDPNDTREGRDGELEAELARQLPALPWQVRNQARMHERNGDAPYRSTADALCHWLETPTAVAVRLKDDGLYELLSPVGLDDLLALRIAPTPYARDRRLEDYRQRLRSKTWTQTWPKIKVDWG